MLARIRNHQRFANACAMTPKRIPLVVTVAWFLFWGLMVSVAVQDYVRDGGHQLWQPVLWESSSMVAATILLAIQRHFTLRYNYLLAKPLRWFALQAAWLPLYYLTFVPIAFGIRHGVYRLAGDVYTHGPWPEIFVYESIKLTVFVGMFVLIRFGILSYVQMLEEKLRVERANGLLRQAQLQRLAQQMQPHFLFNALNTISSLMHTDVQRADATLIQLADVLRTTLDMSDLHEAPLATELRLAQGYARVMQERVSIDWQLDDNALACSVPVMSIQPLLENIFKHTVEQRRAPTAITVTATIEQGALLVRLDDDSGTLAPDGKADGRQGIGLANLRERLAVLYDGRASLELTQLAPLGVRADMRLPCGS
jgi:two-component system LytT family sensor kinase